MSLRHAVLGVLDAREMTGYELTQFFEVSARWVWSAPQSQIYPTLKKMESDGLIAGEDQVRGTRLRRRRYSITPDGRVELERWILEDHGDAPLRDPFLLQMLFLDMVEPDDAVEVLQREAEGQRRRLQRWRDHRTLIEAGDTPLLRERLARRDPDDRDRIIELKAAVFRHLEAVAEDRVGAQRRARARCRRTAARFEHRTEQYRWRPFRVTSTTTFAHGSSTS